MVLLVGGYFYISKKENVEKLLRFAFAHFSSGTLELEVKDFSLFRGLVAERVVLRSGADFDRKPLLTVEKLVLRYYLPGFWVGDIGIHELGLYSPHFYLRRQNRKWNIATLFASSKKKTVKKESKPWPDSINLFFSLRAFARVIIENFSFTLENPQNQMYAEIKDFHVRASLESRPFSRLPLNLSALQLLDSLLLQINPQSKPTISFANTSVTSGKDMSFTVLLDFKNQKHFEFLSAAFIGDKNIPFYYKGKKNMPLGFLLSYKVNYKPESDRLTVDHLRLSFLDDVWLLVEGKVDHLLQDRDKFFCDISVKKSFIDLKKLHPYFTYFTNNTSLGFAGTASLAPTRLQGGWNDLTLDGKLSLHSVRVRQKKLQVYMPSFVLDYKAQANMSRSKQKPLPYLVNLIASAKGSINKSPLILEAEYIPAQKTFVNFRLNKIQPQEYEQFISKDLLKMPFAFRGSLDLLAQVWGEKETDLDSIIRLTSKGFAYRLNHGFSPLSKLNLEVLSDISAADYSFSPLRVKNKKIHLDIANEKDQKALWLDGSGNLLKQKKSLVYRFDLQELGAHFTFLQSVLPSEYQEKIENITKRVPNEVLLRGYTVFENKDAVKTLDNHYYLTAKDLGLRDIELSNTTVMEKDVIHIKKLKVRGLNDSLAMQVEGRLRKTLVEKLDAKSGKIIKSKGFRPDLNMNVFLGKEERTEIFPGHFIRGKMNLTGKLDGNIAKGNVNVTNFYYNKGKLKINDMNLKFPFKHNLLLKKNLKLAYTNKERIIKNYNFSRPYNMSIRSIEMAHPIRPQETFLAAYPVEDLNGVNATIYYDDNVLQMPIMHVYTLNGLVTLKDILFNVGNGKPAQMEYIVQAQVKNTDLKQLIPPTKAKAIRDGSVHMDITFSGQGIKKDIAKTLEELNGNIAVYKVGQEFGKQALKVVKPNSMPFIDLAVDQSIIIDRMDMDFKEGLVYAQVFYHKGILGAFIGPAGNQLIQERIPVTEYWQRARQEVEVYKVKGSDTEKK